MLIHLSIRHVKFGREIYHNNSYTLCVKDICESVVKNMARLRILDENQTNLMRTGLYLSITMYL